MSILSAIAFGWMVQDFADDKSTLVQKWLDAIWHHMNIVD